MNTTNYQQVSNEAQCCIDYCKTSFSIAGKEVVNNYKCNQRPFSVPDLWSISRKKKDVHIKTSIY